jgi:hypothetical protein
MAKTFAWSFSKLKNFETCPRRHQEVDLLKRFKEHESEQLRYGNTMHRVLADAIGKAIPLPREPEDFTFLQPWVNRVLKGDGALFTEQQYAITRDFCKCTWFSPNAWFRTIGDVVRVAARSAFIGDWKSGARKPDSVQLALSAQALFAHFPETEVVKATFFWVAENEEDTEYFTRAKLAALWPVIMERVNRMSQAWDLKVYPPTPSGLCIKYCPVTTCQFHGKGSKR